MSSLTLTTRTVNDAEVFDSQLAAVGRFGTLLATSSDYNIHAGLSGTWVFQPPDQGSTAAAAQRHVVRLRDRPEIRVDSTRLIDTGSIDADSAYVYGLEAAANWKNWYLQAESFRYGIERTAATATLPDPDLRWLLRAGQLDSDWRNAPLRRRERRVPGAAPLRAVHLCGRTRRVGTGAALLAPRPGLSRRPRRHGRDCGRHSRRHAGHLDLRRQLVRQHQREADAQLAARRRRPAESGRPRQPPPFGPAPGDACRSACRSVRTSTSTGCGRSIVSDRGAADAASGNPAG